MRGFRIDTRESIMTILVTNIETPTYILNEDGEFRCPHDEVTVEPPCCNGTDCGCHGMHSVYCDDCDNEDMMEHEIDQILEDHTYSFEPAYY